MLTRFVCALLGFCVHEFPTKSEKKPGHLLLTEGCTILRIRNNLLGLAGLLELDTIITVRGVVVAPLFQMEQQLRNLPRYCLVEES